MDVEKDKEYLNKQGININLTEPEIVSSFHGNVVLDAKGGFGQVIGRRAVEIGVNKAKEYGVSLSKSLSTKICI